MDARVIGWFKRVSLTGTVCTHTTQTYTTQHTRRASHLFLLEDIVTNVPSHVSNLPPDDVVTYLLASPPPPLVCIYGPRVTSVSVHEGTYNIL